MSACTALSTARCDDANVPPGPTYHYKVTAFANGFPGSESVQTSSVSATR